MRPLIVFTALVSFALAVILPDIAAATPVNKETSRNYFNNCLQERDPRMSKASQEEFCACTAATMEQSFTMEELQTMHEQEQESRDMVDKLLLEVYVPCMSYPVRDMIEMQCLDDPKVTALELKGDRGTLCDCMGVSTGTWFSAEGGALMAALIADNPEMSDPLVPVMDSRAFQNKAYEFLMKCVNEDFGE